MPDTTGVMPERAPKRNPRVRRPKAKPSNVIDLTRERVRRQVEAAAPCPPAGIVPPGFVLQQLDQLVKQAVSLSAAIVAVQYMVQAALPAGEQP